MKRRAKIRRTPRTVLITSAPRPHSILLALTSFETLTLRPHPFDLLVERVHFLVSTLGSRFRRVRFADLVERFFHRELFGFGHDLRVPPCEALFGKLLVGAGKRGFEDIADRHKHPDRLFNIQDYVSQVGQGAIPDDSQWHFGREDVTVLKPRHSAFYCTPLSLLLEQMHTRRLILAGLAADNCVLFTAMEAYVRGYELWVPEDCIAAERDAYRLHALDHMARVLKAETRPAR